MNVNFKEKDKLLIFELTEEIDHHESEKMRRKMDYEIQRYMPKRVLFDFNSVTFMDSAGIGMLIGRYKIARMFGATVELINVKQSIKKIFEMCGVLKIIPIAQNVESAS